jgi:hypothetical protein
VVRRATITAIAALVAVAGCGGSKGGGAAHPRASAPAATPTATPRPAPEAIYMFRVLGDDPLPDTVTVRRDGSVLVVRGGGHGGSNHNDVVLSRAEQRKVLRMARRAPLHILAHNTITPGGFGGWDNTMRYLIRRNHKSVGVEQGHIPKPIRPLVRELNRIIENDVGRIVHTQDQSGTDLAGVDK